MFSFVSAFMAKTQNPLIHVHKLKEFTISTLDDFMNGDRDELWLCPIRAFRNTCHGQSSTTLIFPICLSQRLSGRNG